MKILQIINSHALNDGGAQRLALELHRAYRKRGHDAHLLSIMASPTTEAGTYSLGFKSPYRAAVGPRLLRFLRQKRWRDADIVHVHLFPAQPWVALVLSVIRLRAALITTEHNTFNRRRASRLGRLVDNWTLRAYRKIICISDATREALATWQPQIRDKLATIPNGIDLTRFAASPIPNDSQIPLVVSVGRISEQKNYAAALRAIALLPETNFRFQIAGKDEMNGQMQALARELKVAEKVDFLGFQSDIPALLDRADVFLMTSSWEGFGLAVAEAMAAGLAVIAPDVPGVREVVGVADEIAGEVAGGLLIDPRSPASIAAALRQVLESAQLRQNLARQARVRAANFDIQHTIDAHLELYRQLGASVSGLRA